MKTQACVARLFTPIALIAACPTTGLAQEALLALNETEVPRLSARTVEPPARDAVDVSASFASETWALSAPGASQTSSVRTNSGLNLAFDLGEIAGLDGFTLSAGGLLILGDGSSADVGVLQGLSNIEGPEVARIANLSLSRELADGRARATVGRMQANGTFGGSAASAGFFNGSFTISPTLAAVLPFGIDPAWGAHAEVQPISGLRINAGLFDGSTASGQATGVRFNVSEDAPAFVIGQLTWEGDRSLFGVGAWRHAADFERVDGGQQSGNTGFYALAEGRLWGSAARPAVLFARCYGSDTDLTGISRHLAGGISWKGPTAARAQDSLGLGATSAWQAPEERPGAALSQETTAEIWYDLQVTRWLNLKPDFQAVRNVGGVSGQTAWVGTLRSVVSL